MVFTISQKGYCLIKCSKIQLSHGFKFRKPLSHIDKNSLFGFKRFDYFQKFIHNDDGVDTSRFTIFSLHEIVFEVFRCLDETDFKSKGESFKCFHSPILFVESSKKYKINNIQNNFLALVSLSCKLEQK